MREKVVGARTHIFQARFQESFVFGYLMPLMRLSRHVLFCVLCFAILPQKNSIDDHQLHKHLITTVLDLAILPFLSNYYFLLFSLFLLWILFLCVFCFVVNFRRILARNDNPITGTCFFCCRLEGAAAVTHCFVGLTFLTHSGERNVSNKAFRNGKLRLALVVCR